MSLQCVGRKTAVPGTDIVLHSSRPGGLLGSFKETKDGRIPIF